MNTAMILTLAIISAICLFSGFMAWLVYMLIIKAGATAREMAKDITEAAKRVLKLTPSITITRESAILEQRLIHELSVIKNKIITSIDFSNAWLLSRKEISIIADSRTGIVNIFLPAPEILSVENISFKVRNAKSGWCNRINKDDYEISIGNLNQTAREDAENSSLKKDALQEIMRRFKTELLPKGYAVCFKDNDGNIIENAVPHPSLPSASWFRAANDNALSTNILLTIGTRNSQYEKSN
jgi:hypothetical protein